MSESGGRRSLELSAELRDQIGVSGSEMDFDNSKNLITNPNESGASGF